MDKEKCGSCDKGEVVDELDEGGNHIKKFSCGHRKVSVRLIENLNITDTISVNLGLYFELTESVSVAGIRKSSNDIELVSEDGNPNMLKAFKISVRDYQDKKEILTAFQHASRFTNLITLKTGMFVFHKRPRKIIDGKIINEIFEGGTDSILTKLLNLDMTDPEIINLLKNDSRENQQLAHFANGQRALRDGNYVDAIKEFYQVTEYENLPHLKKYKYLRDGISHAELNPEWKTVDKIKIEFGITCIENPNSTLNPKGKYVDITSPEIQNIFEKEANYLRDESIRFIDGKVKVKTN